MLATGSVAMPIPGVEFGGRVVDTWGAWSLPEQPKKIAVVGAGASGSEIASAYGRFGTEVLLVEMLDQILPAEDKDMARVVERAFKKQNITISTGTPVENVEASDKSVKFTYGDQSAEVDHLCIAGGRRPDTDALNLDAAGVKAGERGQIEIDEYQRTSNAKVYAIGDLVRGPALAHKASEEGVVAAETIVGEPTHPIDVERVAGATFCHPQVASVGLTEALAKEAGHEVKVGKFKLGGAGASVVYDDREGLCKLVVDSEYGEILGAHIVGNRACDMIAELVAVMDLEGGYQELARIIHPHPTISEAILDAARAVDGWAIHASRRWRTSLAGGYRRASGTFTGYGGGLLLRLRLALRLPGGRADQRALRRSRRRGPRVAADPARRPLPALRPLLVGARPEPRGGHGGVRAPRLGLRPAADPLARRLAAERPCGDARRDLREGARQDRLVLPRGVPPGLRRRPRPR